MLLVNRNVIAIVGAKGFLGNFFYKKFESLNYLVIAINNDDDLGQLKNNESIKLVINCAGSSNVPKSLESPIVDFEKNSLLVIRILDNLRQNKRKDIRFVNLSSAAVYGNPVSLPISEVQRPNPISPYGYHKLISEIICKEYSQIYGLENISLRIFSAYGVPQRKMLFWDICEKANTNNKEISLLGTGRESRDFIHVEDIFMQLLIVLNNAVFSGEVINIANGEAVEIKRVADLFCEFWPSSLKINFSQEKRSTDPVNWCADITLLMEWGYSKSISIEKGIHDYIKWYLSLQHK